MTKRKRKTKNKTKINDEEKPFPFASYKRNEQIMLISNKNCLIIVVNKKNTSHLCETVDTN